MKKTFLQELSNILFYMMLIGSCCIVSWYSIPLWEDFATLFNVLPCVLIFFSGFFHHIAYKYNSLRALSNITLILRAIMGAVCFIIDKNHQWIVVEIIILAILLIFHLLSCGKPDCEIKIHEFDVKMEDGRYEKVTVKEKINKNSNQIDAKTIIKKLLKCILIIFVILVVLTLALGVLFIVDSEADFKEKSKSLPKEVVSQEYLDEFNLDDYTREDLGSRYLGLTLDKKNAYYGLSAEYIIVSEPTAIISESHKVDDNAFWQLGDNKNFIMNLVDEDFGNYSRAYYIHKDCVFPNETNKIVKVIAEFDKELNFDEKQINYIENAIKNFDNDIISQDRNEWLNEDDFADDYALVFCFEDFEDIYLTCCSIIKDKNGQWYLYRDWWFIGASREQISLCDLEKLPQDICDTINESIK